MEWVFLKKNVIFFKFVALHSFLTKSSVFWIKCYFSNNCLTNL